MKSCLLGLALAMGLLWAAGPAAAQPTVSSVSPNVGSTAGGELVTISGADFITITGVSFGGVALTVDLDATLTPGEYSPLNSTTIFANTPAGVAGTVNVTVTTVSGTSAPAAGNEYTYVDAQTVTSLSPTTGPAAGGTTVVLTGTGFTGATAVAFGGVAASGFTVDSATQITATAPAGSAGVVNVRVTTPGGQSPTGAGNQYSYVAAPTVTSLSPAAGPLAGGNTVVLTGTGFSSATAVAFGGVAAGGFTVDSATQITATAPSGSVGAVNVRVTTVGGVSATGPGNQYAYAAIPSVSAVAPGSGPTAGGSSVVLTGTGFSGATAVSFGGAAATGFVVDSATQITATSPAGSAGVVHIAVTTPGGTSATHAGDQFTYIAPLVVTAGAASGMTLGASYSQANPASGGVSPYSYVLASGALPGGVSLNVATGLVSGTPAAAGAFSYAVGATDSQGTPATATGATVSGTIAKGAQTIGFAALPNASLSASPLTLSATATSGLAVTFSAATPTVCTASGMSLTLLAEGSCTVDADQAGDANWTAAPTVQQSFMVGPLMIPSVAAASATVVFNTAATIDLAASIAGAHSAIAIATPPSHGSAVVAGDVVTYTPQTDYIGADSFTYTAAGPGGTSGPATVMVTVAAPPPPVATPVEAPVLSSVVEGGAANQIDLSSLVSGAFTRIEIVAPPAHGTLVLSASLSSAGLRPQSTASAQAAPSIIGFYTAHAGYHGPDSFQFVAIGPGGTSAPATVSLTVTGSTPTVLDRALAALAGQVVDVNLVEGATEGPFTAAAVVAVSPMSAGTALIRETGAGASRSFVLTFTPDDAFTGVARIDYTLSNAWGASPAAALTITLEPRPDPTADPDVRGLADAQAETVRRFGWTQLGNFTHRLEAVRSGSRPSAGGLSFASGVFDTGLRHQGDGRPGEAVMEPADDPWARAFSAAPRWDNQAAARASSPPEEESAAEPAKDEGPLRFWSGGSITVGRREGGVGTAELDLVSAGVSGGADMQLSERAVLGAGLGMGRDITDVGIAGSRSEARNLIGAAYFSIQPTETTFLDGVIGGGELDFDLRRLVPETMGFTTSDRSGALAFGSVGGGVEAGSDRRDWSAYGRLEFIDAELDAHAESGAGLYDLAYGDASVSSFSSVLGARASFASSLAGVPAQPMLRLEWRHEFQNAHDQRLRYADWLTGPEYALRAQGWARDRLSAGAGVSLVFEDGWTLDLEGGAEFGDATQAGSVSGAINKRF